LLDEDGAPALVDAALACTALARCGSETSLEALRERVARAQATDGGWPAAALYHGVDRGHCWWGSRAVTTVLCLEALAAESRTERESAYGGRYLPVARG
jgi:hypothetical protein